MDAQSADQARAEAILGELAELGLMLARELAVRARAAEDPADTERLVSAFNKTSRGVRLTLALNAKLARDAQRWGREEAEAAAQSARAAQAQAQQQERDARFAQAAAPASPVQERRSRVKGLLNRLLWNESEGDEEEYEVLGADLDARLHEASQGEGFLDLPITAIAQQVASDMGLSGDLVLTLPAGPKPQAQPDSATPREPTRVDTG